MGAHQSRDSGNGDKRRRRKINTTTSLTNTTNHSTTLTSAASLPLKKGLTSSISSPASHQQYQQEEQSGDVCDEESSNISKPKYSPFYKRSTLTPHQQAQPVDCIPVSPVRHQVVLSDQVMPLSSLVSISRHLRRSNSTKSKDDTKQRRSDNSNDKQSNRGRNSSGSSGSNNNNSYSDKTNRRFSLHRQKSGPLKQQRQPQDYDAISAISGMTSEDDESRTNPSSSRSAIYASSVGSSSSMHLSPTHAQFLNRRLSINNDKDSPTHKYGNNNRSGKQGNPIVFDTSLNAIDPDQQQQQQQQQQQRQRQQSPQQSDRIYDYGHEKEYNR
jgi:hypothetical protein